MIMCAIAGILGSTGENREVLESMLKTMTRRGPDQWGIFQGKGLSLLHARLAVVDLEGGRQPMELYHKGVHYHMVYNGELYTRRSCAACWFWRGILSWGIRTLRLSFTLTFSGATAVWSGSMAFLPLPCGSGIAGGFFWLGIGLALSRSFMPCPREAASLRL